jgi:hypothetical protein
MAIISNTDVYQTLLDNKASKADAALVALGSTLGMYSVDRYLGLGEMFFDDLTSTFNKNCRLSFKKASEDFVKQSEVKIDKGTAFSN